MEHILPLLVQANLIPAFVGLIGLPLLYTSLAAQMHRDYADLVKDAQAYGLIEEDLDRLNRYIDERSGVFRVDWWIIAAFGVLLFVIMGCGALPAFAGRHPTDVFTRPVCSAEFNDGLIRSAMALYGTLLGVVVGFRLLWARLALAQEIRSYYACGFKPQCADILAADGRAFVRMPTQ